MCKKEKAPVFRRQMPRKMNAFAHLWELYIKQSVLSIGKSAFAEDFCKFIPKKLQNGLDKSIKTMYNAPR